jgi:hypothetical protein
MLIKTMCCAGGAFGAAMTRRSGEDGFRLASPMGGATCGFVPPGGANRCPDAEKPAAAGTGRADGGK